MMTAQHTESSAATGELVLRVVRAGFVARGTTLARWCGDNNVSFHWARQSLLGRRDGPAARALRNRLLSAAGITR